MVSVQVPQDQEKTEGEGSAKGAGESGSNRRGDRATAASEGNGGWQEAILLEVLCNANSDVIPCMLLCRSA